MENDWRSGLAAGADDRLSLFASAIAGRRLSVLFEDVSLPHTDGEAIFLAPVQGGDALLAVAAQGSLVAGGSLDPEVVVSLGADARAARRYVSLELARILGHEEIPVPRRLREPLTLWAGPIPQGAHESLAMALDRVDVPECPEVLGTVRPRVILRAAGHRGLRGKLTARQLAKAPRDAGMEEIDDDETSAEPKVMKKFLSSAVLENPVFKVMRKQLGMGSRSRKDDGADGDNSTVGSVRMVERVGEGAVPVTGLEPGGPANALYRAANRTYPEWDVFAQCYRPAHCNVGEFAPAKPPGSEAFRPPANLALRRRVASLGLSFERHRRLAEGDELDAGALTDFAVDRAIGETPDPRVFAARRRTGRDLGVVVLLDASGSTAQRAGGMRVWEQHRTLAAELVEALELVGDRVAAFGFNSRGRHHVRFLAIKDFDQRFSAAARRRLGALEPSGYTRIGAAIRHATEVICAQSGAQHRLVVMVSDGFAYDDGYEGRYAEADTRQALDEAHRRGVGCICISVGSDTESDVLERLWGNASHIRLDDAAELSDHVVPLVQASLRVSLAART